MRKLFLLTGFFVVTPAFVFLSFLFLVSLSHQGDSSLALKKQNSFQNLAYAALPTVQDITEEKIDKKDARVEIVKQFFAKYDSPLEPFAADVVAKADQYKLDYRLIPAIAMQESNLCKKMPENSYNCWGFGIYGGKVTRFESFKQGIDIVTKSLVKNYKNKGLDSPEEIVSKYTPSDNGRWSFAVNHFMEQLQ